MDGVQRTERHGVQHCCCSHDALDEHIAIAAGAPNEYVVTSEVAALRLLWDYARGDCRIGAMRLLVTWLTRRGVQRRYIILSSGEEPWGNGEGWKGENGADWSLLLAVCRDREEKSKVFLRTAYFGSHQEIACIRVSFFMQCQYVITKVCDPIFLVSFKNSFNRFAGHRPRR